MWGRVGALLLRYLYLYRRSLARSMEIFFWPVMDLLVWGFVSAQFKQSVHFFHNFYRHNKLPPFHNIIHVHLISCHIGL